MTGKRMWQTIRLYLTPGVGRRTEYYRKKHIFASMGENCSIMDRKVPLYSNLIKLGNNVHIASKVDFIAHDITHCVLNNLDVVKNSEKGRIDERVGCIEIGDNVFIGTKSSILSNVKIGSNVIIGACSLVNKDIPDNSVAAGVPAKVIGSFDDFLNKRLSSKRFSKFKPQNQEICDDFARLLWAEFYKNHN